MKRQELPIAIIGAGPIGLAATAHLLRKRETPVVFEAGPSAGAAVLAWGHVRLFSPWRYVIDREAEALLEEAGWRAPDLEHYPTGQELVEDYLIPLANLPEMQVLQHTLLPPGAQDAGGSCAVPSAPGVAGQDDLAEASASCCTPSARQLLTVRATRSTAGSCCG